MASLQNVTIVLLQPPGCNHSFHPKGCIFLLLFDFIASFFDCSSYLYQIAHLGDDDDEPEFSSAMPLEEGDTFFFAPRPLRNLVLVDELDSLSPILACQVADLGKYNFEIICSLLSLLLRSTSPCLR
jgi:splicing factor 3B subunit 3